MRVRHLMMRTWVSGILLTLTTSLLRPAPLPQQAGPKNVAPDPDKVIADLREVAIDLTETTKRFQTHLDREITLRDRGYRAAGGRRISGADADLIGGPADKTQAAMRKLFAARMIAARKPGYEPLPLADLDRIQALVLEARARIATGNEVMRRFLMISAKELNSRADGDLKRDTRSCSRHAMRPWKPQGRHY